MVRTVLCNHKGTTLIEVLVAMVITTIIFAALVKTSLLSANNNVENMLRDEAVAIAETRINEARNTPFATLVSDSAAVVVTRDFRNITGFQYSTNMVVTAFGSDNKQVAITVSWSRKGVTYKHTISTIVRET